MSASELIQSMVNKLREFPLVRKIISRLTGGNFHLKFRWKHPIDKKYGVDTSGFVDEKEILKNKQELAGKINPYMGVQPSVVRQILDDLPDLEEYSFIDLGCGKGRATIVASEYPFKKITGIEISPRLARVAQKNAAIIRKNHPSRTPIDIIEGNAIDFPVSSKVMIYIYNSFGDELTQQLMRNIEKGLAGKIDHLFLVFHNPVTGKVVDDSLAMKRWFAGVFVSDLAERNYGYNKEGATVIWQSVKNAYPDKYDGADQEIVVVNNMSTRLAA